MNKICLFGVIFFLTGLKGFSQAEVKLYTTIWERLGAGIEYLPNKHVGWELGSSYWQNTTSNFYVDDITKTRKGDFYLNIMAKRYSAKKLNNAGFFVGAYLRYWKSFSNQLDHENWTEKQINHAINTNGSISSETHKISMGVLFGHKTQFNQKVNFAFTFGIGGSIPPAFWKKETLYDKRVLKSFIKNDYLGRLNLISLIGQLSICYRLGQS